MPVATVREFRAGWGVSPGTDPSANVNSTHDAAWIKHLIASHVARS